MSKMSKIKKFIGVITLLLFLAGLLSTGCTRYASQEQMSALKKACDAATAAEQRIEELKSEKAQLGRDIAAKEEVLGKLTRDRDAVK